MDRSPGQDLHGPWGNPCCAPAPPCLLLGGCGCRATLAPQLSSGQMEGRPAREAGHRHPLPGCETGEIEERPESFAVLLQQQFSRPMWRWCWPRGRTQGPGQGTMAAGGQKDWGASPRQGLVLSWLRVALLGPSGTFRGLPEPSRAFQGLLQPC